MSVLGIKKIAWFGKKRSKAKILSELTQLLGSNWVNFHDTTISM